MKYLLFFFLGCGFATVSGQLRLQDRELLIHPDKPVLAYPYKATECEERKKPWKWMGEKCKEVSKIDEYDLNSPAQRQILLNAGFSCKSKMRFKY